MLRRHLNLVQDLAREDFDQQPAHKQRKNSRMSTLAKGIAQSEGIKSTSHSSNGSYMSNTADSSSEDESVTFTDTTAEPPIQIWDSDSGDLHSEVSSESFPVSSPPSESSRDLSIRSRPASDPPNKQSPIKRVSVAQGAPKNRMRIFSYPSDPGYNPNPFRKSPQAFVDRLRNENGEIIDKWSFDDDGDGDDSQC